MTIVCAQCGDEVPANRYGSTSTLCAQCIEERSEVYRRERPDDDLDPEPEDGQATQGKRPDQVEFSAAVFIGAALLGFVVVGVAIGIALAQATVHP